MFYRWKKWSMSSQKQKELVGYSSLSLSIFVNIPNINLILSESIFTHEGWYYSVILSISKFAIVHLINQVLLFHTLQFILL